MLKLTRFDDRARDVWISPKHIIAILDDHEKTFIQVDHGTHEVCETPEQILAMPEMKAEVDRAMYDAYPPMKVDGSTSYGDMRPPGVR